jgi:arylsulfatase A-like enzyme
MGLNKELYLIFYLSFTAILFSCKNTSVVVENESVKKPNVIFILADDLGVNDLSYTGSKYYETPNIDRIANEGIVFTQGYATCQVCSPSRASILTGQFPASHGITDWIGAATGEQWAKNNNTKILPSEYIHAIPNEDITIAEAMKSGGYKTFFAGKWHLGDNPSNPENNGFDINKGGWEVGNPKGGYYAPWDNPKLEYKYKGENLTMRLAQETVNFITENKDKPFFAYLSFYAVHSPIETTEEKWSKYRNKAEAQGIPNSGFKMERILPIRVVQDNPVYAGLIESMDDAVGFLLDKLKELNLDKNTIIVFTSDNGGVASGDGSSTSNLPLRGGKGYQWEGGIRAPYFIKVPYLKNGSKKIEYPVSGIDFYPTLLDLAGIQIKPTQKIDGISLVPLLKGKSLNNRALFWHYPHYGNQGGEPVSIIRREEWKLIHYWEDGHDELYNLSKDSGENHDLSKNNETVAVKLRKELDAFLADTKANIPVVNPKYDDALSKKQYENRKTKMLLDTEKQRKNLLDKNFQPNADWWNSKITKD